MPDGVTVSAWPDLLKPATAAALLDMGETTFRAIFPVLAARYGLKIIGVCGPRFVRANLLEVFERVGELGLDINVDKAAGVVKIGDESFPITNSRTGKSRRGRPRIQDAGAS